jgi:hypothetical protein
VASVKRLLRCGKPVRENEGFQQASLFLAKLLEMPQGYPRVFPNFSTEKGEFSTGKIRIIFLYKRTLQIFA